MTPSRNSGDTAQKTRKHRTRARPRDLAQQDAKPAVWPGAVGGLFKPLSDKQMHLIHQAALDVLETVGMAEAPDFVVDRLLQHGGKVIEGGRLTFPCALVEDTIANLRREMTLHGQVPDHDLELTGSRVYFGSGGAAPSIIDLKTGRYRPSMLEDLYNAARVVDALDNIHFFSRSVVARDMSTSMDLDVNTAYACLAGTVKHVCVSATEGDNVRPIADMCEMIAGSRQNFVDQPFLSLNINHVVPPLRFSHDACAVLEQAALHDVPFLVNSLGQAGASSPASLAGSLVQSMAETLAGMVFGWLINPQCRAIFGPRPLVTDLRTGAMTGGCGEQAVVMAGAAQMARYYQLPNSCIAGATDSKIPDAQSGYEKAMTVSLAAHAGCNMITQACGMQASLMGCSFESYVIDNDMLGGILRSVRGIEADEDNLSQQMIAEAVRGEGHFLGAADTYARMQSDFLYPEIADRQSSDEWEKAGAQDIRTRASERAFEILDSHFPHHLSPDLDDRLRARFDIHLPTAAMAAATREKRR